VPQPCCSPCGRQGGLRGTPRTVPEAAAQLAHGLQPASDTLLPVPPGTVHGRYLADTKEYADSGVLQHEGEVKVYLTCANRTRSGRWTLLAGHSAAGWMPPPVPLAYAALAASTVTTLRQWLASDLRSAADFHVEIEPYGTGNREQAQAAAVAGTITARRVVRTVVWHGASGVVPVQAIEAALQHDPLTTSCRVGGVLLDAQMVVR
jgi:hypothetical protein